MADWRDYLEERQASFVEDLKDFLRIPSISADPAHLPDVDCAAAWVAARLQAAGLAHVEVLRAGCYPMVYGDWLGAPGQPTVLIYGHFDVQPVDPVEAWTDPPFSPTIRDGRIYARGASDDKGNMLAPILALEALLKTHGRLPVNVKVLFEGQEEILSPDLPDFVALHRTRLACDMAISADGWQWSATEADLRVGLRGICALEVVAQGPATDLHAGLYGGAVANPVHALVALLASIHDASGRVTIPGFYDDVRAPSDDERRRLAAIPFDEARYRRAIGVSALAGEAGFTTRERIGIRPTFEINGITGGYTGPGVKTIIPSSARAAVTCRLVPDQAPETVALAVKRHLESQRLNGIEITVNILPNAASPYLIPMDHPANRAARDVLVTLYGREPYYTRSGGSIPILDLFRRELDAYTVIYGFGLPDENFHAPDEFLRLDNFRRGQEAYALLLEQIRLRWNRLIPSKPVNLLVDF
ncbi:dipeptidase [Chelatococcus asaccharovorans]|uniref:dipeptidase n=1 Tax=Chelatococcus asaccharovorans TaxID=28210 RepID=UPI00224C6362|nr:dipeptidase [Chelatococcus asaccharovorans]CAH1649099.1 Acetylornithine deacetylase/succinyl-diaminopimelate desuccinylase-like protein [Chelatococcus asaccharovorans]CAH1691325.1 Acetylornithine deacetylase/succinyl-diaminopimelate desuccinylase-like protein [Chelatococcus asaccharovorans]